MRSVLAKIVAQEDINFLLTNRLPRRLATRFVGWFSKIENPLICRASIASWKLFTDLDLSDAATARFPSLHACFTRQLKPGSRPPDPRPDVLVSPCDAIVGAAGRVEGESVYQIKGYPYTLTELLGDANTVGDFRDGRFVTLRLTSSMYHRFHAPHDCRVEEVIYISGDTWNVNPIALKRVERLFCKNERAVVPTTLAVNGAPVTLVAVAAILVASIRLHCLDAPLNLTHRGPNVLACDADARKGEELGWFEHGSTIIVFAPEGFELAENVRERANIRVGAPLMRLLKT